MCIRDSQVTQVRGFADQNLRKPDNPLDPANRRISLIVQYVIKDSGERQTKPSGSTEEKKPETEPAAAATPSDKQN